MTKTPHSLSSPEPMTDDSRQPASRYFVERVAPRAPGALVPNIERVRLLPLGVEGSIVNISAGGMLVSCRKKLGAGMAIRVVFEGNGAPPPASGKVARSLVASIGQGGEVWYHVGIAFDQPIDFESPAPETTGPSAAGQSPPGNSTVPKFVNRW